MLLQWIFVPSFPTHSNVTGFDQQRLSSASSSWLQPWAGVSHSFVEEQLPKLRHLQKAADAASNHSADFYIDVCLQHSGDLVYLPPMTHHATYSITESVAVSWREQLLAGNPLAPPKLIKLAQEAMPTGMTVPFTYNNGAQRSVSEGRLQFDESVPRAQDQKRNAAVQQKMKLQRERQNAIEATLPTSEEIKQWTRKMQDQKQEAGGRAKPGPKICSITSPAGLC